MASRKSSRKTQTTTQRQQNLLRSMGVTQGGRRYKTGQFRATTNFLQEVGDTGRVRKHDPFILREDLRRILMTATPTAPASLQAQIPGISTGRQGRRSMTSICGHLIASGSAAKRFGAKTRRLFVSGRPASQVN